MKNTVLYTLNSVAVLIVCSILIGAFYFQFGLGEDPCPLCLLQRMGMLAVIVGLVMNTYFGFKPMHFALVLFSSILGLSLSTRQVLLHICPGPEESGGYGTAFMGMHLYTWGVIIFISSIIGVALFLIALKEKDWKEVHVPSTFEKVTFYIVAFLCFANVIATFFECQLGPCCENGPCL